MSVDLVVFLKFAAILGGLIWLSRRASRVARTDAAAAREQGGEQDRERRSG